MKNPFWRGRVCWESYQLIKRESWQITWDSLLNYHDLSLSTPNPLRWLAYYSNNKDYFQIGLIGFHFILYKKSWH